LFQFSDRHILPRREGPTYGKASSVFTLHRRGKNGVVQRDHWTVRNESQEKRGERVNLSKGDSEVCGSERKGLGVHKASERFRESGGGRNTKEWAITPEEGGKPDRNPKEKIEVNREPPGARRQQGVIKRKNTGNNGSLGE